MRNKELYPPTWATARQKILARDRYRCGVCGVEQFSIIERLPEGKFRLYGVAKWYKTGREIARALTISEGRKFIVVVLQVAHLYDSNPAAVDESNLGSRCPWCHLKHDLHTHVLRSKETRQQKKEVVSGRVRDKDFRIFG